MSLLPVSFVKHLRAIGAVLVCAAWFHPAAADAQDTTLAARSKGAKNAPVTVYEMADFQCPVCRTFAVERFPEIEKDYIATGKVRWIFINLPIPEIHPNAEAAAEFAVCASRQGKFWPTHDLLYGEQDKWEHLKDPVPYFMSRVTALRLNRDGMLACLQSRSAQATIRDDMAGAQRSGAHATPSFYIEGGIVEGLFPIATMRHILDSVYTVKAARGK